MASPRMTAQKQMNRSMKSTITNTMISLRSPFFEQCGGLKRFAIAYTVGADLCVCPGLDLHATTGADTQVCPYTDSQTAINPKAERRLNCQLLPLSLIRSAEVYFT